MKNSYLSICVLCVLLNGCAREKVLDNNLIHIDVTASYPIKDIKLEEVADIEYLQLEFDEDFLFSEAPSIISANKIIFCDKRNGNILVFSRDGKPISIFNHKGQGPEEYDLYIEEFIYDEAPDDLFVILANKILVYSSSGEFKRRILTFAQMMFGEIVNNDLKTFLLYNNDESNPNRNPAPFSNISKEDGNVVESINIPIGEIDKKVNTSVIRVGVNNSIGIFPAPAYHIVRHNDGYLLTDFSTDTVYFLSAEKKLSSMIVRQPAIQSMEPAVILNSLVEAGNYQFASIIPIKHEDRSFPVTYLMRDKQTGSIYRQKITFNDYKGKEITLSPETIANTHDSKLGLIVLSLMELQEASRENKLSGKLKELVDNSDEDGNDVYMLLHFR